MPAPDATDAPPAAAAPAAPVSAAPLQRGSWRVGTLVYTTPALVVLFAWLLWGDFAWNMKERAIVPLGQLMLRGFEASDFVVGLLVGSIPSAIGLIVTPIVSVKSDRHRGRFGRRIPFLILPTPFIVASMFGLASTPVFGEQLHALLGAASPGLVACRLAVFAFFWTSFEIFQTIAQSVFGGLINDVVPREVIGRFYGLFRAVSLLAAIVFNLFLIGHAEAHATEIFLGLGLLFGVGFALMCLRVKEGDYPPPPPPGPRLSLARRLFGPIRAYVAECYTRPYYLWVFFAFMLGNLAAGPVNTFSVFYAKSLGLDMAYYGRLLVATYVCSFALSFFIGWLADKFHPLRLAMIALGAYGLVMLAGFFLAADARLFPAIFISHGVLSGVYFTGSASLTQRLFPRDKFAQFNSACGIMGAFGYFLLTPALGLYLDFSERAYRHTFFFSGLLALLAVAAFFGVWRRFRALGGPAGYVAP